MKLVLYPLMILFVLNVLSVSLLASTLAFTQPTTVTIGTGGINYQPANLCNNPLSGIPVIGNIFAFFSYLGSQIAGALGGQASSACLQQAGGFVTYTYNPTQSGGDSFAVTNFFVDIIPIALIAVALLGINVLGTGYNTGAVLVLVVGGALMLAWAVLSGPVIAIFFAQSGTASYALPVASGGLIIYGVLTLVFTVGTIGKLGGVGDDM